MQTHEEMHLLLCRWQLLIQQLLLTMFSVSDLLHLFISGLMLAQKTSLSRVNYLCGKLKDKNSTPY